MQLHTTQGQCVWKGGQNYYVVSARNENHQTKKYFLSYIIYFLFYLQMRSNPTTVKYTIVRIELWIQCKWVVVVLTLLMLMRRMVMLTFTHNGIIFWFISQSLSWSMMLSAKWTKTNKRQRKWIQRKSPRTTPPRNWAHRIHWREIHVRHCPIYFAPGSNICPIVGVPSSWSGLRFLWNHLQW